MIGEWFMMACISFVALTSAATTAPALEHALPLRIEGGWTVVIGPGSVTAGAQTILLPEAVVFDIAPVEKVRVRDERYNGFPLFDPKAGPWRRGAQLRQLITEECTATGVLIPESVRVKSSPGSSTPFALDKDYTLDGFWANIGRTRDSALKAGSTVFIDYDYVPCRLDSLVVNAEGRVTLVRGKPGVGSIYPPDPGPGNIAVANIWLDGPTEKLDDDNLYPVEFAPEPVEVAPRGETRIPKTLAKLRAGEEVTIVAWGDSVTNGGGVTNQPEDWYQAQFLRLLRERFPKATINLHTAAWGGSNSANYMKAPAGGEHDFVRDVLDPKPDLVMIEFVNDAYLDEEATQVHYRKILDLLQGVGAEVILITPHYVRPDWMNVKTQKLDNDPRPYVKGLKRFAAENNLAIADASKEWGCLWRQGIPYMTLEANSINHPDRRGHAIFAKALMELFE